MAETVSEWRQERPAWCPHAHDCRFIVRSQDAVCIGELPEARDHAGTPNTHRLCQRGAPDDDEWLHTVEWNRGDAWNLWRCLNNVFRFVGSPDRRDIWAESPKPDLCTNSDISGASIAQGGDDGK